MLSGTLDVWAQDKGGTFGTGDPGELDAHLYLQRAGWQENRIVGPNPKGSIDFDSDGRFSMIIMNAKPSELCSKIRTKGTARKIKQLSKGSCYFGSYEVANERSTL